MPIAAQHLPEACGTCGACRRPVRGANRASRRPQAPPRRHFFMIVGGLYSITALRKTGADCWWALFFDWWWALFGNRAAGNNNEGDSVY